MAAALDEKDDCKAALIDVIVARPELRRQVRPGSDGGAESYSAREEKQQVDEEEEEPAAASTDDMLTEVVEGREMALPGAVGAKKNPAAHKKTALETARRCHKLRERGVGLRRQDLASREGHRWPDFRGAAESDDVEKRYP